MQPDLWGSNGLNPDLLAKTLLEIGDKELRALPHNLLYQTRTRIPKGEQQDRLAGAEHRAFARESVIENPLMAISLMAAIPGYQAYKMVTGKARSESSLDQVLQGYAGVGEGLSSRVGDLIDSLR